MKGEIDTNLFVEIIQTDGVTFLHSDIIDGDRIEYYHGPSGKKVPITMSDEFLTERNAKSLLRQLGMEDLADRIF